MREKAQNAKLEKELKKKYEIIGLINKQLSFIPKLMTDLQKKKDELKSSEKEKGKLGEELKRLNILMTGTTMTSLKKKRENAGLTKQVEAQKEELEHLKEEIRKLKGDSAKVNQVQCSVLVDS